MNEFQKELSRNAIVFDTKPDNTTATVLQLYGSRMTTSEKRDTPAISD
jgi:hypothetical protein